MRKYKGTVVAVQVFCILLLIMSKYLGPSLTQMAYCFTVFSSPFLLLAFGEQVVSHEGGSWSSAAIFIAEFMLSFIFIGTMITGMQTVRGFGTLLVVYCLAGILSIAERVATRAKA